jgi:2-hydroxycyclohexanecarboxyl-CoA dehydrogenase
MRRFTDRRFLVTGSTQGVGFAVAEAVLRDGGTVTISGRRNETVRTGLESLETYEGRVFGFDADLTVQSSARELVSSAQEAMGGLDGIVLSHGGPYHPTLFEEYDAFPLLADYIFLSLARMVHAAIPFLSESSYGGRIVSIISDAARAPTPGESMIGALAAANIMFTRTLAREVARKEIRMNTVAITITRGTPTYSRVMEASSFSQRLFETAEARIPLGPNSVEDIIGSVLYFLSDAAAKVTGQVVSVNGGLST